MKMCLDHMRKAHSFFVLDVQFCTNLKGLLSYVAERVHLGYLCLFCGRMFKNARRCQQHMMDKSHCFMNPNDEHEYRLFYDFAHYFGEEADIKVEDHKYDESLQKVIEDQWEEIDIEDAKEDDISSLQDHLLTPQKSKNGYIDEEEEA